MTPFRLLVNAVRCAILGFAIPCYLVEVDYYLTHEQTTGPETQVTDPDAPPEKRR